MKKLILLPLLLISFAQADTLSCKVIDVTNGDNIICLTEHNEKLKVRLFQISAPKADQDFGQEAKQVLSDTILGKNVRIVDEGWVGHLEILGTITLPPEKRVVVNASKTSQKNDPKLIACEPTYDDINQKMIERGMAWYYPSTYENHWYAELEGIAKKNKVGLWSQKNPVPPWEWKKQRKGRGK